MFITNNFMVCVMIGTSITMLTSGLIYMMAIDIGADYINLDSGGIIIKNFGMRPKQHDGDYG